jgi:hypothetical protein
MDQAWNALEVPGQKSLPPLSQDGCVTAALPPEADIRARRNI